VYAAGVRNRTNEEELRRIISDAGYMPAQRDTLYRSYALKPAAPLNQKAAAPLQ
jgi:cyclic dehypoxanthinyl futalosine synthase